MRAQDAKGEDFEKTGEDLLARAFLHETDHLYGKLYITHISALKRDLMKRKIKKLQRAGDWELERGRCAWFPGTPGVRRSDAGSHRGGGA